MQVDRLKVAAIPSHVTHHSGANTNLSASAFLSAFKSALMCSSGGYGIVSFECERKHVMAAEGHMQRTQRSGGDAANVKHASIDRCHLNGMLCAMLRGAEKAVTRVLLMLMR